jgi:hypothetical protein
VASAETINYSFVHISDLQYVTELHPNTANYTFSYLESQKSIYNISAIINTGDFVQNMYNDTQWIHYLNAKSHTSIPIYESPGNHDVMGDNRKYPNPDFRFFDKYIGTDKRNYSVVLNDLILISLNAPTESEVDPSILNYAKNTISENPTKFPIILSHTCMYPQNGTLLESGLSIKNTLILRPSIILCGHFNSFVKYDTFNLIPFAMIMTNYQNYRGSKNISAGRIFFITSTNNTVKKITMKNIMIYDKFTPTGIQDEEIILYDNTEDNLSEKEVELPSSDQLILPAPTKSGSPIPICIMSICILTLILYATRR